MAVAEFKLIYALNPAHDVTHEADVGAFDLVNVFYWSVSRPNINYEKLMTPILVGQRSISSSICTYPHTRDRSQLILTYNTLL